MKLAATFLFLCTLLYQHVESTEDWSAYGIRWAEMPPLGPTHEPTILAKRTNPSETIAKANPKNRRDLLRTYMSLISYMHPFQNNGIALDVQLRADIRADLNASGVLNHFTTGFLGNEAGASQGNPLSAITRIGVAYGVWVNNYNNTVTVLFPGTFSQYDLIADFAIWGKALLYDESKNSLKRYKRFDLPEELLRPRDPTVERMSTMAFKAIWPAIRANFTAELRSWTNLTESESVTKGYVQLAIYIVENIRQQFPNHELKLTGQSLGAGLAQFVSLYLEATHGLIVDTPVFSGPGSKCTPLWRNYGWDTERSHPQIVNYRDIWDNVGDSDYGVGVECWYDFILPGYEQTCASIVGLGVEIPIVAAVTANYTACFTGAHSILRAYQHFALADDNMNKKGRTTDYGCRTLNVQKCPDYYIYPDGGFF